MSDAITRKESLLKSIADGTSSSLKPITREEQYLAYIAGETNSFPLEPITREEAFLDKIAKSGGGNGGSGVNVQPVTLTSNGTHNAPEGIAWTPVQVNVPQREDGKLCDDDFYEDGVVKLVIYIPEGDENNNVRLRFRQQSWWKCEIDWGDGSAIETQDYSGNGQTLTHAYGKSGYYVIRMIVPPQAEGNDLTLGVTEQLFDINRYQSHYRNRLIKAYIGYSHSFLYERAFANHSNLATLVMHDNTTMQYSYTFQNCTNLMNPITIPSVVKTIASSAFSGCSSLPKVIFHSGVTKIAAGAFSGCYSVMKYDFSKHTTVPTLDNASAFQNINGVCQILVPANLYDEWIAATNWATLASKIVAV